VGLTASPVGVVGVHVHLPHALPADDDDGLAERLHALAQDGRQVLCAVRADEEHDLELAVRRAVAGRVGRVHLRGPPVLELDAPRGPGPRVPERAAVVRGR